MKDNLLTRDESTEFCLLRIHWIVVIPFEDQKNEEILMLVPLLETERPLQA